MHRRLLVAGLLTLLATQSVQAATLVVDDAADDLDLGPNGNCTLREAVLAADQNAPVDACPAGEAGPVLDRIVLPAGSYLFAIEGRRGLLEGDLEVTDALRIEGAGSELTIIDAAELDRVFRVDFEGSLWLRDLTVRGGRVDRRGGGIWNLGELTLERTVVRDNLCFGDGGGILNESSGRALLVRSTVRDNGALDDGGGILNRGELDLLASTVSGNGPIPDTGRLSLGSGIMNSSGTVRATSSTISGNTFASKGGGLYNLSGSVALLSTTVAGNEAVQGEAYYGEGISSLGLASSIVTGSCWLGPAAATESAGGSVESPGDECGLDGPDDRTDVAEVDLGLGPLGSNGGPTRTHALEPGSVAIDARTGAACARLDQRGFLRVDGACDAGAFELEARPPLFSDGFESADRGAWDVTSPATP